MKKFALIPIFLTFAQTTVFASSPIAVSYHWHMHQPIYWPNKAVDREHYENAWDTIIQQSSGRNHPLPENLANIFGIDDRIAAYQDRPGQTVQRISYLSKAGAQVSYSGALIENIESLASHNSYGYHPGWNSAFRNATNDKTKDGAPRMDLVLFTFHHSLSPLLSDETLEMELRLQRRQMELFWGSSYTRGYFPTEMAFSERLIPILKKMGVEWSIVSNSHLSRASSAFPLVLGSGGENCDIPNRADQINPSQNQSSYQRITISRGVSPAASVPFDYRPHVARYVDPMSGKEDRIIVVPADQALGWQDGYGPWNFDLTKKLSDYGDQRNPPFLLLAHDGDNAWGGGYSYYMEWVPQLANVVSQSGSEMTTIEEYLYNHPVNQNDLVHVEDGAWVNADGDFGSPSFINWHWPLTLIDQNGKLVVDPVHGQSDKADVWRVHVATENLVKTCQQISGISPRIDQIRDPGSFGETPQPIELGWHYYLAGLDSGFVYYGCHDDECVRPVIAQQNAVRVLTKNIHAFAQNPKLDKTPPTLFLPQRHPWNPGARNYGVQYGYRVNESKNSDFYVWTYAYDLNGISKINLNVRSNGKTPPSLNDTQYETYRGGDKTASWRQMPMNLRISPATAFQTPDLFADIYWAQVKGFNNEYLDYYVEAVDTQGNLVRSPIQHVYVGQN